MDTPSLETIYSLLKQHVEDSKERHRETTEQLKDFGSRISKLENWRSWTLGGLGATILIFTSLIAFIKGG